MSWVTHCPKSCPPNHEVNLKTIGVRMIAVDLTIVNPQNGVMFQAS